MFTKRALLLANKNRVILLCILLRLKSSLVTIIVSVNFLRIRDEAALKLAIIHTTEQKNNYLLHFSALKANIAIFKH